MTDDPVLAAVQKFMDAVEVRLGKQDLAIRSALSEMQTRSSAAGPQGERGAQGERGEAGPIGPQGEPGVAGAAGPTGERGQPGERGADGVAGRDGAASVVPGPQGAPGERGADGVGRDGPAGPAGRDGAIGPAGERGERGADGIATRAELEAIVEQRVAEINVRTFADVYRGVYDSGVLYARGLVATWGGSLWLSLNETRAKPGESNDWRLIVKAGRDGKK